MAERTERHRHWSHRRWRDSPSPRVFRHSSPPGSPSASLFSSDTLILPAMGKRKNRKDKQQRAQLPIKKPHVEKETSFAEIRDTFLAARGQEVEKDAEMKKHLDLFLKTCGNVKTPANEKVDSEKLLISTDKAFQLIIQAALIHLESHVDESLEVLKDLLKSWTEKNKHMFKVNKDDNEEEKDEHEEEEKDVAWADVAVDAIISMLLTCNNRCLRMFLQGTKKIANYTTNNIVESICSPLIGDSDSVDEDEDGDEGQSDAAEDEDSESDGDINEEMDEDESDDEDSWEDVDGQGGEGKGKEEEVKELEKLKAKLERILYSASTGKSSESKSTATADEDESEDGVDDETMFALDDAIAAAFKEKFASKKSVLDGKEEVFKCRILKIIQCYTCHRERKSEILIPVALQTLLLLKVSPGGEFKSRLIETLGEIFDCKNKTIVPTNDENLLGSLGQIFEQLISLAGSAKNCDESTLLSKGLNWALKMDGTLQLTHALAQQKNLVTLTSNTFVSLSQICSRATGLQLLKLMVNGLISEEKDIQMKPLQLAHAFKIISHALAKFVNNGQNELPANVCKQVWTIAKDKASQLTGHLADGKCKWLLLSNVLQTLNYLKIIHARDENNSFSPNDQLLESLGKITGKNRKKLPKAGQSALKNLLNVCKKHKTASTKSDENDRTEEDKTPNVKIANESGEKAKRTITKSKIPVPKVKRQRV